MDARLRWAGVHNKKIYCRRLGCLSASETEDAIGFRQQLITTSFEAFELEITVNYPVHTWTENGSFMRNLASWLMPFWLVLLTEHKLPPLPRDEHGLPLPGCRTIVPVLWILLSRMSMLPTFQPLSVNSLSVLRAPYRFDRYRFKIRISSFCEIFMILLIFLQIFRSRQFQGKVGRPTWNHIQGGPN